jgi:hypothetical protein
MINILLYKNSKSADLNYHAYGKNRNPGRILPGFQSVSIVIEFSDIFPYSNEERYEKK